MMDHQARAPGVGGIALSDLALDIKPGLRPELVAAELARHKRAGKPGEDHVRDRLLGQPAGVLCRGGALRKDGREIPGSLHQLLSRGGLSLINGDGAHGSPMYRKCGLSPVCASAWHAVSTASLSSFAHQESIEIRPRRRLFARRNPG
jgi:hypothetical protein